MQQTAMIHQYDYLVIGSGIAGMSFALKVAEQGKFVAIICKTELEEANTYFAQRGDCLCHQSPSRQF